MARKAFFSFHYERDVWRASQIRNSWVTKPDRETAGFWDSASWEQVKRSGDDAVKSWINRQLEGTSVTVVLVGAETSTRQYVNYEIEQSYKRGNGLLAIYIHNMKDMLGRTDYKGANPLDNWYVGEAMSRRCFSQIYSAYDWVLNDGHQNLGNWIEQAAKQAGK